MGRKIFSKKTANKSVEQLHGGTTGKVQKIEQNQNVFVVKSVEKAKQHLAYFQIGILAKFKGCGSICDLISWYPTKDTVKIVLQYGGPSLQNLISNKAIYLSLSYSKKIQLLKKLAIIYKPFYKSGIVHNDIKPANIVVSKDWQVKFIDLALCSAYDQIIGSSYYCRKSDLRNNLFLKDALAYGIVCYRVIQGKHPWSMSKINNKYDLIKEKENEVIFSEEREINKLIRGCLNPDEEKIINWVQIFQFWNIDY